MVTMFLQVLKDLSVILATLLRHLVLFRVRVEILDCRDFQDDRDLLGTTVCQVRT